MHLDRASPLVYSVNDGIMAVLALIIIAMHLIVFVILLRDRRDLKHTIIFGLIVLYIPVAGPIGYLLWRDREPQKQALSRRNIHRN